MGILLKDILLEAKLYSYTISEVLDEFLKFDGRTLIFLDTETTGLDPNDIHVQLTQVACMVVDGSTWKELESFSTKINLRQEVLNVMNDPQSAEAKEFEKHNRQHFRKYKKPIDNPADLLKKTNYDSGSDPKMDEKDALLKVQEIVEKYDSPIILAHNAQFDMKAIQSRRRINGLSPLKRMEVLDTLNIARYYFIPALVSLQGNEEAKQFLQMLLAKTKYVSYSTALGRLAQVFQVKADNWHDASADIHMLLEIMRKMIEFLKKHKDLDIRKYQGTQAKRFRRMNGR